MKIEQTRWTPKGGWAKGSPGANLRDAQLVLLFGGTNVVNDVSLTDEIRNAYAQAYVFGCSTAGEIYGTEVTDGGLVATAVRLDATRIEHAEISMSDVETSREAGERLAQALPIDGLVHVFVLSDGLHVNGSELVAGLTQGLPADVSITGGLSGDGDRFEETFVVLGGSPKPGAVGVLGFYGTALKVGYASLGGWDAFGPERLITKSEGNVLYELDGKSALQLYKTYLGEHAAGLPATGLLFPLSVRVNGDDVPVVRTILGIDEEAQSMTFAGDVPTGAYARLMKANFDRLIDGAVGAAKATYETVGSSSPELAILISCVGRKLVLKQRVEEEVEGVREVLGDRPVLAGFYSYGEISPFTPSAKCELHNQTMTITTFSERAA
jgi:hypothetical protein